MPFSHVQRYAVQAAVGGLLLASWFAPGLATARAAGTTPAVGSTAPDVTLDSLRGGRVRLSEECRRGPVVLVILRGYPGYQCPVCTAQVAELVGRAGRFRDAGARVILVYPGPAEGLKAHADEFVRGKALPENFDLLLDPDYALTQSYGLRWDAPNETAYPSSFVLDRDRKVRYAKVSSSHKGRAKADALLEALAR